MGISLRSLAVAMIVLSVMVLAPLSNTAVAQERPSVFQTCYRCGTGLPGAATLTLRGTVSEQAGMFKGYADVTQAVNPPLMIHVPVTGYFDPNCKTVELVFAGAAPGGAVKGVLILSTGWGQPGKGAFYWYGNKRHGDSGGNVPAAPCK